MKLYMHPASTTSRTVALFVADNNLPVYGSVDPQSQRAAWSIGKRKDVVFETGLNNLTQEQTSLLVTTNLDFADWTQVFGDQRLTAGLLDRLTFHAHILPFTGESYRLRQSVKRQEQAQRPGRPLAAPLPASGNLRP